MIPLLTELSEFLEREQDTSDSEVGPIPNWAMLLKRDVDAAIERIRVYQHKNPLGGPAKVFEAMADCIRAGDDYHAVLAEYGFQIAAPQPSTAEVSSAPSGPGKGVGQGDAAVAAFQHDCTANMQARCSICGALPSNRNLGGKR